MNSRLSRQPLPHIKDISDCCQGGYLSAAASGMPPEEYVLLENLQPSSMEVNAVIALQEGRFAMDGAIKRSEVSGLESAKPPANKINRQEQEGA